MVWGPVSGTTWTSFFLSPFWGFLGFLFFSFSALFSASFLLFSPLFRVPFSSPLALAEGGTFPSLSSASLGRGLALPALLFPFLASSLGVATGCWPGTRVILGLGGVMGSPGLKLRVLDSPEREERSCFPRGPFLVMLYWAMIWDFLGFSSTLGLGISRILT